MTKILFIHHSTGANLIKEGNLRIELQKLDTSLELWDHSFNYNHYLPDFIAKAKYKTGLSDGRGNLTHTDYNIVLSNDSPKEYSEIFARPASDPTLSSILSYDIVSIKNCYPTTNIKTEENLNQKIELYKYIIERMVSFSDKKFVILTPPPMRKQSTKVDRALRAKSLANWLLNNQKDNVKVFDFFSLLSDNNEYLREEYTRPLIWDSHPNKKANIEIAPVFAQFLYKLAN